MSDSRKNENNNNKNIAQKIFATMNRFAAIKETEIKNLIENKSSNNTILDFAWYCGNKTKQIFHSIF